MSVLGLKESETVCIEIPKVLALETKRLLSDESVPTHFTIGSPLFERTLHYDSASSLLLKVTQIWTASILCLRFSGSINVHCREC